MVRHLDDLVDGEAPELHVPVDEPHRQPEGERRRGRVVRRGAGQREVLLVDRQRGTARFHAKDEAYFDRVSFWKTPTKDCGDDRGDDRKDYSEWVKAWTEVKG